MKQASFHIKEFIKSKEGFSTKPYLCSAGVPTIGFGSTLYPNGVRVTLADKEITKERAEEIFDWHLSLFEKDVNFLLAGVNVNQNQFDALLSFAYNVGSDIDQDNIPEGLGDSTLLKKVRNNPEDVSIEQEFLKWNKAKGVPVRGLTLRRQQEANIYFNKFSV